MTSESANAPAPVCKEFQPGEYIDKDNTLLVKTLIKKGHYGHIYKCQTSQKTLVAVKVEARPDSLKWEHEMYVKMGPSGALPTCIFYNNANLPYYLEFSLEGKTFAQIVEEWPLRVIPVEQTLALAFHGMKAFEAIHQNRVNHRNVKLENLCLSESNGKFKVVLLDFYRAVVPHYDETTKLYAYRKQLEENNFLRNAHYASVRVCQGEPYCEVDDITSFAFLLIDLRQGFDYFKKQTDEVLMKKKELMQDVEKVLKPGEQFMVPFLKEMFALPIDGKVPNHKLFMNLISKTEGFNIEGCERPVFSPPSRPNTPVTLSTDFEKGQHLDYEKKLEVVELLGSGRYGKVYECRHLEKGFNVAVKIELKEDSLKRENEIYFLLGKNNKAAPDFIDFNSNRIPYYLVISLEGKSFADIFNDWPEEAVGEKEILSLAYHGLKAFKAIHELRIIHRDVRMENMCLSVTPKKFKVLLIDFGLSTNSWIDKEDGSRCYPTQGNIQFFKTDYASVRVHEKNAVYELDDLHSFGYLLLDMCRGFEWFDTDEQVDKKKALMADVEANVKPSGLFLAPFLKKLFAQQYCKQLPKHDRLMRVIEKTPGFDKKAYRNC